MEKNYIYCLRCGRRLKNPEYKKIGMGKTCQEKAKRKGTTLLIRRRYADGKDEI